MYREELQLPAGEVATSKVTYTKPMLEPNAYRNPYYIPVPPSKGKLYGRSPVYDDRFYPHYLNTRQGLLRVVQILSCLIGYVCIQYSPYSRHSSGAYYSWIAMMGCWCSLILLLLYLCHVIMKMYKIPWLQIEFWYDLLWSFFFLVASCVVLTVSCSAYIAAGVFGFVSMLAYMVDAYIKYVDSRAGRLAQGAYMSHLYTIYAAPESPMLLEPMIIGYEDEDEKPRKSVEIKEPPLPVPEPPPPPPVAAKKKKKKKKGKKGKKRKGKKGKAGKVGKKKARKKKK